MDLFLFQDVTFVLRLGSRQLNVGILQTLGHFLLMSGLLFLQLLPLRQMRQTFYSGYSASVEVCHLRTAGHNGTGCLGSCHKRRVCAARTP